MIHLGSLPHRTHRVSTPQTFLHYTKCSFFKHLLMDPDADLWHLASWHHGKQDSGICPLHLPSGELTHDSLKLTQLFWDRFFDLDIPEISGPLPPPCNFPLCKFPPITEDKVLCTLQGTAPSSALGPSSIGYPLVYWAFSANPQVFLLLWNSSLSLCFHPWGEAKVVIIFKPHKPDYALTKAYCPISLLECHGKVLQKIVVAHLSALDLQYNLLGPCQFGSQKFFSAPDAATFLHLSISKITCD